MSAFVDVDAEEDGRRGAGGRRPGAGRPRGSGALNPEGIPVLNKQSKYWLVTIHYDEGSHVERVTKFLSLFDNDWVSFVVFGREVTQTQGLHLQCYLELTGGKRGRTVKAALGIGDAHFDVVTNVLPCGKKTTYQHSRWNCFCYCTKGSEQQSQEGANPSWDGEERGVRPPRPAHKTPFKVLAQDAFASCRRGDWDSIDASMRMRHANALLIDRTQFMGRRQLPVLPGNPRDRNVWIVGPGDIGKSYFVWKSFRPTDVFLKDSNKWWSGYNDEPVTFVEEIEPGDIKSSWIKKWADVYPFMGQPKQEYWKIRPSHTIVTSNYSIDECYTDDRQRLPIHRRFTEVDLRERCAGTAQFCACVRCGRIDDVRSRAAAKIKAVVDGWGLTVGDDGCYVPVRVCPIEDVASTQVSIDEDVVAARDLAALAVDSGVNSPSNVE